MISDGCPFRFENKWLRVDEFSDKIRERWVATNPVDTASFRLFQMLKFVKAKIKKWCKEKGIRY